MNYSSDIPLTLAVNAYAGISMSPEKRGESTVVGYAAELAEDYRLFRQHAEKGGTLELLEAEFERYRAGVRKHYTAWLSSKGRCMSTMITGPSNFPVRRMEKRNRIEHNRLEALLDFQARARRAVIRTLRPDLRPIMSGDADALERLAQELDKLEARQSRMKAINLAHKLYVKNPDSLDASGLSETDKAMIRNYQPAYSWEPHPFAPYQLTNNGANIRRIKARMEGIARDQAKPVEVIERSVGGAADYEDDPPANRVRLRFPGKPSLEVRTELKKNGFRWTPSQGVWQAYRNPWSVATARKIAGLEVST